MNPKDTSRKAVRNLPKTIHGGQAWKLPDVEDYSQNLNPYGPPKEIMDSVMSAISGIGHYPDDSCTELRNVISDRFGVEPDNVIIGAGSSDIIRMFPNTFLGEGTKAIIPRPSFAEYSHQCRVSGASVIDHILREDDDFRIDRDRLMKDVSQGAKAVYICNPNNPTGRVEPREKILAIAEECEKLGAMVFVDETLLELVPDYEKLTCSKYVSDHPNMVVTCSLTKSFAIPGIRIGFGFGDKNLIDMMNKVRMTWNVGQIEQNVAISLIRDHMDYVRKGAETLREEADWMYGKLKTVGFPVSGPTDSFFFFNSVEPLGIKASEFKDRMLTKKFMVRDCASFGDNLDPYVRFCVKDRSRDEAFIDAVDSVLRSLGR